MIGKILVTAGLGLVLAAPVVQSAPQVHVPENPLVDFNVLHAQVILDHLGFSPGLLDGREGQSFTQALRGFQTSRGLPVTGKLDARTLSVLHRWHRLRPVRTLALTREAVAGPFVRRMPDDPARQAELPTMGYADPLEKLAEMFHTTPQVIAALNPPHTPITAGTRLVLPNALPRSRDYPATLDSQWRRTLSDLNVDAVQPRAERVVVDKSAGVLRVYGKGDRLVAQFPATMGSRHDPLPLGRWKIQGADYNPKFHYNPKLFWDVSDSRPSVTLPPGPNGPVGVVWLDLSKPHYGIHGTPDPASIGHAESHGCIRLTNWDAARLSLMVAPGTPAIFQR